MYRIALCEDDVVFSVAQEKICREILGRLEIEFNLVVFQGSADFMEEYFEKGHRYDLILLDIIMDGVNGMELARRIRQTDQEVALVFITSSMEYALEGYDVRPLQYLMKPLNAEKLQKLIETDYNGRLRNSYFVFTSGAKKIRVPISDIIYMETSGRQVKVVLKESEFHCSGKLVELLDQLPEGSFVRCHQAFAINLQNIQELTRQDAIMIGGHLVPVSRTFSKDVQKAFLRQMGNALAD